MAHFLLIYDRSTGTLVRQEQYDSGVDAMRARFKAEIEFDGRDEIEVAALDAASEEDLRRTHGRYFLTLAELADRLG
ncbi:MAG: hypothetical protein Q7T55_18885 [Solirubrobacteraceae bacterium]|nr:hypothetical protein [Solirubrobacteraceae bacterium]